MADLHVVEELRAYLIAQGVAQDWNIAASTTVPGIMLQPRDGAPLPRDGENATITIVDTSLGPPHALEAWIEETFVDVIVRSRTAAPGKLIHRSIRGLIHPISAHGGRQMWTMAGIDPVEYSTMWRPEQPLPPPQDGRNISTYDRIASYRFGVRRKTLAGLSLP